METWFLCQRCGNCCRWPGFVRLGRSEPARIASYLGLSEADFVDRYTVLLPGRDALGLKSRSDGSCIFLAGRNSCNIQPVKPLQCRGFPNAWRFPGWREVCEAIEIAAPLQESCEES